MLACLWGRARTCMGLLAGASMQSLLQLLLKVSGLMELLCTVFAACRACLAVHLLRAGSHCSLSVYPSVCPSACPLCVCVFVCAFKQAFVHACKRIGAWM